MGIFGSDERDTKIAQLINELNQRENNRKKLIQALTEARQRVIGLEQDVARLKTELDVSRQAIAKARRRQKASVERANRFKRRLGESETAGCMEAK